MPSSEGQTSTCSRTTLDSEWIGVLLGSGGSHLVKENKIGVFGGQAAQRIEELSSLCQ